MPFWNAAKMSERSFCGCAMSKRKSVCLALVTMLLWGSLFPMVKLGYAAFHVESVADTVLFAGIRFAVCGGIICLFGLVRSKKRFLCAKSSLLPILLSGVFAVVLHYGLTYIGMQYTDSSKTAILKQVGSLFYICFSSLFFKSDRLTPKKLVGVTVGFLGIGAINYAPGGFSFHMGDILIIAASFCMVFSSIISKKVFRSADPIAATGISQLFGGLVLLSAGLLAGGRVSFALDASVLIFVYISAASVVSYCIWYTVVKQSELSGLFLIKFTEPVFSVLLSALILGENIFKLQYLLAMLLISGGICIANLSPHRRH